MGEITNEPTVKEDKSIEIDSESDTNADNVLSTLSKSREMYVLHVTDSVEIDSNNDAKADDSTIEEDDNGKDDKVVIKSAETIGRHVVVQKIIRCTYDVKMTYDINVTISDHGNIITETETMSNKAIRNEHLQEPRFLTSGRKTVTISEEPVRVVHAIREVGFNEDNVIERSFTAVELQNRIYGFCTTLYKNHEEGDYPLISSWDTKTMSLDELMGSDKTGTWYGSSDGYYLFREADKNDNFDGITRRNIDKLVRVDGVDIRYPLAARAICKRFMKEREVFMSGNFIL